MHMFMFEEALHYTHTKKHHTKSSLCFHSENCGIFVAGNEKLENVTIKHEK